MTTPLPSPAWRLGTPLIEPSEATVPNGCDNVNGDLIVSAEMRLTDYDGRVYSVEAHMGRGHFGQVYRVLWMNPETGDPRPVAMKISKGDPAAVGMFEYESQALSFLCTNGVANVSKFISAFVYAGHCCIVVELLGPTILNELDANGYNGLPLTMVQFVLRDILHTLSGLASYDLVHCDIKPENVLFADSEKTSVRVIDYGSCCMSGDPNFTYVQSRYYRSPEVALGLPFDSQADIWSAACVAAEMMLGLPLFPALNMAHLLVLMDEMLGPLPEYMTRGNEYYTDDGILKSPEALLKEHGVDFSSFQKYFVHATLDDIVMGYAGPTDPVELDERRMFLSLLHDMLKIDPSQRLRAEDALMHPFIATRLSGAGA